MYAAGLAHILTTKFITKTAFEKIKKKGGQQIIDNITFLKQKITFVLHMINSIHSICIKIFHSTFEGPFQNFP